MDSEVTIEPLTDELSNSIIEKCKCVPILPLTHNKVFPSGINLPIDYVKHGQSILDMEVREDDIWVISFPRSGTTWTQEMVWLLKNELDFEKAKEMYLYERFRFLEFDAMFNLNPTFMDDVKKMKSPRFIKSHLHKLLLPKDLWTKKPKIVYIYRNPKDAAVSSFHHYRLWNSYTGSLELFLKAFIHDKLMLTPFWDGVLEFWKMRNEPNILFITYEEMKKDLGSVVIRVADFLGVKIENEDLSKLLDHLSFSSMKNNKSVNLDKMLEDFGVKKDDVGFIREGESGGWRKVFTPEMEQMFDEWTAKMLEDSDFPKEYL